MDERRATKAAERLGIRIVTCFLCERQFALRDKVWVVKVRVRRADPLRKLAKAPTEVRRIDGRVYHLGRYYCSRRCARTAKREYNDRRHQSRTVAEVRHVEVPR